MYHLLYLVGGFLHPIWKKKGQLKLDHFLSKGYKKTKKKNWNIWNQTPRGIHLVTFATTFFREGNRHFHRWKYLPPSLRQGTYHLWRERWFSEDGPFGREREKPGKKIKLRSYGKVSFVWFLFPFLCEEKYFGWWLSSKLCNNIACKLGWTVITCSTDFVLQDASTIQVGLNILHETCRTDVEVGVSSDIFLKILAQRGCFLLALGFEKLAGHTFAEKNVKKIPTSWVG